VKGGIFVKKLKTQQGEQLASSALEDNTDFLDVWLTQRSAWNFKYVKGIAGSFLKKGKREKDERPTSSTVQESHDIQKVGLAQINSNTFKYNAGRILKQRKIQLDEAPAVSSVQDSHDVTHSYHPHAVVFDSPGCKTMLSQIKQTFDARLCGSSVDLQHLDITNYLSAQNLINTCNSHLERVYRIVTDLSDMGVLKKHTPLYNLATHSMDKIEQAFDPETGQVRSLSIKYFF
jgi:hypothetical protein